MAERDNAADGPPAGQERRVNPDLRKRFEQACQATAPLFDAHNSLGSFENLRIYSQRTIHDLFPDLTIQEVALLASSVWGYHRARLENRQRE